MIEQKRADEQQNGGLIGIRPSQTENLATGFGAEIGRPILKAFWAVVFWMVDLGILVGIALTIGPSILEVGAGVVIIVAAIVAIHQLRQYQPATQDDGKFLNTLQVGIGLIAAALCIAVYTGRDWLAALWPPVSISIELWQLALLIFFAAIPFTVCAFMGYKFLIEGFNPAAFQPYQSKPADTPWWMPTARTPDAEPGPEGLTLDEIRTMIEEVLEARKQPQIKRDTVITTGVVKARNGNGRPAPGAPPEENSTQEQVESVVRDTTEDGRITLHLESGGHASVAVLLDMARHYVRMAARPGSSSGFSHWRKRGLPDKQHEVLRRVLAQVGMLEPGNGQYRESVTWLVDPDTALAEFDRIFSTNGRHPPTPEK